MTPAGLRQPGARQPGARQPGARQPGARQPGARQPGARTGRWERAALAAFLLALVFVGLRGGIPHLALDGRYGHHAAAIAVGLELVLAALLAALAIRRRRAPREAVLAARLRAFLSYLVGAGLIAVPLTYLLSRNLRFSGRSPRAPAPARRLRLRPPRAQLSSGSGDRLILVIVLALIAVAAVCLIVLAALRLRRHLTGRPSALAVDPADDDGADPAGLRAAVESGRSALRLLDDARAAIIACYLAMEQSLAEAGAARDVAETPDELLARAAAAGLVHGDAAAQLTALFYEARFSSHPLPPGCREAAERALSVLAADLGQAAAPSQAAAPEPAAAPGHPGRPAATGEARP
jgi:Domain of unknown function (DUF4129)